MSIRSNLLIGQILVDEGIITLENLQRGLDEQKKTKEFLCSVLIRLGISSEDKIFTVLARQLHTSYIKLKDRQVAPEVIAKVPAKFASHYRIIPWDFSQDTLTIAMANPLDIRTLDDMRLLLGFEVKGVLASEAQILEAIRKYYGVGAETLEQMVAQQSSQQEQQASEQMQDIEDLAEDASVIKFVNQILSEAVKERASDIHLEPFYDQLRVRFRIDGLLYPINIPDTIKYFHAVIVSRIKIMAELNIAERRLPQDGRIKIKVGDIELDLRVSTIPTAFGESVHIRILSAQSFLELEKLGMDQEDLVIFEEVIKKPHGILFVTGPTGSGKSTTLYAGLARINSDAVKIITVEDPIETQLKGVNQIQVNSKIGLTFAAGLRHILRHDPDVIMVGEVRDFETAEIAIRSALTGHFVFSTLHTNDAAGSVTRLLDMGIEPFLVASSIECLIAQRLVRLICPQCKVLCSTEKQQAIRKQIKDVSIPADAQFSEGKGCPACRFTGYRGRTGIHEVLVVNDAIRELILQRASSQQIKQKAISLGMRTLRQSGLKKVFSGLTTIPEVVRVSQQEELNEE